MKHLLAASALAISTFMTPAFAQNNDAAKGGAAAGAATGAVGGAIVGGPVGAVVGGVGGAVVGATVGSITPEDRRYVRERAVRSRPESMKIRERVAVGESLPGTVRYYQIEGNPRLTAYRYAYVNDQYVLVDAGGRIVSILEE